MLRDLWDEMSSFLFDRQDLCWVTGCDSRRCFVTPCLHPLPSVLVTSLASCSSEHHNSMLWVSLLSAAVVLLWTCSAATLTAVKWCQSCYGSSDQDQQCWTGSNPWHSSGGTALFLSSRFLWGKQLRFQGSDHGWETCFGHFRCSSNFCIQKKPTPTKAPKHFAPMLLSVPCLTSRLPRILCFTLSSTLRELLPGFSHEFAVAISPSLLCYHPTPTPCFFLFLETCSRNTLLFLNSLLQAHEQLLSFYFLCACGSSASPRTPLFSKHL